MFQTTKQNSMGYPTFRESQIQVTTPHVLGVCNYQILSIRWVNSPAGLGSCWYVMICPSTHAPRMLILSPVLQFTSPLLLKSNMSLGCIKVISHHIPPCCWIWSCWLHLYPGSSPCPPPRVQLSAPAGKFPGNGLAQIMARTSASGSHRVWHGYQWSIFHCKIAEACTRKTNFGDLVIWHLLIWFNI